MKVKENQPNGTLLNGAGIELWHSTSYWVKCKGSTHKGALSKLLLKRPWDPDFVPVKLHLLVVDFNLKSFFVSASYLFIGYSY